MSGIKVKDSAKNVGEMQHDFEISNPFSLNSLKCVMSSACVYNTTNINSAAQNERRKRHAADVHDLRTVHHE